MDDLWIVELYHRREERAIAESDKKYGALCRSIALRPLGHREDAEECVNDTWYVAWDKMPPDGPQALEITDVFDPEASDFTPMTTDVEVPIILSQASHAARVVIDEEGCTAVAFTVMANTGAGAPPNDEVDFILDRSFIFCITGDSGLPLFVGVVNYPAGG